MQTIRSLIVIPSLVVVLSVTLCVGCAKSGATSDSIPDEEDDFVELEVSDAPPYTGITQITLERTPCFGQCPVYSITIRGDGTFTYAGAQFVDRIGTHTGRIPEYNLMPLLTFVASSDFMNLKSFYTKPITDLPTSITTVVKNGQTKRVSNYANAAPPFVWAIEELIDKSLEAAEWDSATPRP